MRLLCILAAVLLLAASSPLAGQLVPVTEHTLSNGMKVLVHEDHDLPSAALYLFFRVGSRNERPGVTGISHFFEHMMFNGAAKYGPKQFDIVMEANGGANNAYTSRDVTVYTDWFPSAALELMFDMEADRIANLQFDPNIVESERGVVANERRLRSENSAEGALYELLNAAAYVAHPYSWPVIGWASDIEAWTMEDLERHYRIGYAPNNCVVVVSGDVTPSEVLRLARTYFEPLPSQDPPPAVRTIEPEQRGERRVELRRQAQLPVLLASYHVPRTSHADYRALEVLGAVLTSGRSSRLYRRLVDGERLVREVDSSCALSLDPGQFLFDLRPLSGVDPARVEAVLYEELRKLRDDGATQEELRKAKNLLLVDLYRDLRTIAGKARLLGEYEVFFGGHARIESAGAAIEAVTAADVQRVARLYFKDSNRTVATLIPDGEEAE